MFLKKVTFFSIRFVLICILLLQTACWSHDYDEASVSTDGDNSEGRVIDPRVYEKPSIDDETSLLHPNRLKNLGIKTSWSVRLQKNRRIRNYYILKDSVIVETEDRQIHSINRFSGQYNWIVQIDYHLDFPPYLQVAADGKRMLYMIARNHLYCIDCTVTYIGREVGRLLWRYKLDHTPSTAPHANDYSVIIGAEDRNFVMSYHVKKVGLVRNETQLITPKFLAWHRSLPDRVTSSPASTEDYNNPVAIVACHDGKIYGFDFKTSKKQWEFPKNINTGGQFKADLIFHSGKVFAANTNHTLYVLEEDSGASDGKITLQAPLSRPPWVVGEVKYNLKKENNKVIDRIDNDLDIFIQTDRTFNGSPGYFYRIVVEDVVVSKEIDPDRFRRAAAERAAAEGSEEDFEEDFEEEDNGEGGSKKRYIRRWDLGESWKLEGRYAFLFRTENFVFLRTGNNLVKVHRHTGRIIQKIDMGDTPLRTYRDITKDYLKSRLYVSTDRDIYSLELNSN